MATIVILDQTRDLTEWLTEHRLTIRVWRHPDGWLAKFAQDVRVNGSTPRTAASDPLGAVMAFVQSVRGAAVAHYLPGDTIVPEFTGIDAAVSAAEHQ